MQKRSPYLTMALLIAFGVIGRLVPHPPNVTPVLALALVAGALLPRRRAVAVPLATMAVSDLFLGLHPLVPFTWGSFLLVTLFSARLLRKKPSVRHALVLSIAGSTFFFVVTNAAYWASSPMYPKTLAGLGEAFFLALPFFRNMILGDLTFTALVFGALALAGARQRQSLPRAAERRV